MEGNLTYLRTLVVVKCPSLTSLSLSIKHLTALGTLIIGDCEELSLMEMEGEDNQDLKLSLQKLIITDLPKLEVLPQWLRGSANTLQLLLIVECENLNALPEWLPQNAEKKIRTRLLMYHRLNSTRIVEVHRHHQKKRDQVHIRKEDGVSEYFLEKER
nr:hypothetical protein CFP56_40519 [Quercus suber]